jgi:hypothetical protein
VFDPNPQTPGKGNATSWSVPVSMNPPKNALMYLSGEGVPQEYTQAARGFARLRSRG